MTWDRPALETERSPSPPQTVGDMTGTPNRPDPANIAAESLKAAASIERSGADFILDASLIGELLDVQAAEVPALMRNKCITSACESGMDADSGTFRLNLFYGGRHARLRIDATGRILQRSIIDLGERPLPQRNADCSGSHSAGDLDGRKP
jgi:hypothetical protein